MKRIVVGVVALLAGCDDALDQRLAIVKEPRILAIVGEPAEARPGDTISYNAIVANWDGPLDAPRTWSYCTAPKPPTEDNAVSVECIEGVERFPLGEAPTITASLPIDGCVRFGPDTPPGGFRPRDPDPTGGYYQPVRVDVASTVAVGMTRITCNLPNVLPEIARRYMLEYVANVNPTLDPIDLPATLPADTAVTLAVSWPSTSVETYLHYDQLAQALVDRRESMRLSWFATGGTLAADASAVDEADSATMVTTTWHTPIERGSVHLWFVLRDSRGGIATASLAIEIE